MKHLSFTLLIKSMELRCFLLCGKVVFALKCERFLCKTRPSFSLILSVKWNKIVVYILGVLRDLYVGNLLGNSLWKYLKNGVIV